MLPNCLSRNGAWPVKKGMAAKARLHCTPRVVCDLNWTKMRVLCDMKYYLYPAALKIGHNNLQV